MEQSGNMNFILGFTYEIDSWMDLEESLQKAAEKKKFASARIKPNWIKLFIGIMRIRGIVCLSKSTHDLLL